MNQFIVLYNQAAFYWFTFCLIAVGLGVVIFAWSLRSIDPVEKKPFDGIKESSL